VVRRLVVLVAWMLVSGAAVAGLVSAAPAMAQQTTGSSGLCDTESVEQFTDLADTDYAAAYVLCMRALGLSTGAGPGTYGPDRELNRGQMASFLVRLWRDVLGNDCPAGVVTPFTDVEAGSTHADNIECLYGLGITTGTGADTYGPRDPLKATQISRFLYRTYREAGGDMCPGSGGSELDRATACLVRLRVVPTAGEATATTPVTRAQMAVYMVGLWHNLSGRGIPPPPPPLGAATVVVEAPEVRDAEVRMGIYACCADLAFWQIPIELGWWDELNITITPNQPTYRYFTHSGEIMPWLWRGEGDVAQAWVPGVFPHLETFGQSIPPIHFTDIYLGYGILVSPHSSAKTALEFMDEGMTFPEAARAAVEQLVGKEVHIPPHSTVHAQFADAFFAYLPQWWEEVVWDIPALDSEGNQLILLNRDGTPSLDPDGNTQPIRITSNDWRHYATPVYVDDATIAQRSAVPGRIEFAMPYGGPTQTQMMRDGWDPLINYAMMYEHDAASRQTAITSSTVGGTGLLARRAWVEENKDLAYRVVSVANRVLAFLDDPRTRYLGWEIEAGIINEKRGLRMDPEDIGVIWDSIHPSFNWEEQEALWDVNLPSYHPETVFVTQIGRLKANGTLTRTFDTRAQLEQFLLAQEIYYDLKGMQDRSDELFVTAGGMYLSDSQQALVDQARVFYDRYNFYDALRFLEAALVGPSTST